MREWRKDPQQFASYRGTSAKTPLAPILTTQFYPRLERLCQTQGLTTPRFTRSRCGSGNGNGPLFQTLQHSERLLRLAESEFLTRPRARGEIQGVPAAVFQEQVRRADRVQLAAQNYCSSLRGARLRRMPALPAAAVGIRPAHTDQKQDLERALAEELGFDAPAETSQPELKSIKNLEIDETRIEEVRAKTPAAIDEDQDHQHAVTTQDSASQLRCMTRVPLMHDRVAALTEDAEAVVGWCNAGDIVQIMHDDLAAPAGLELDLDVDPAALVRCLDNGICGWVALKSQEGKPQLVASDSSVAENTNSGASAAGPATNGQPPGPPTACGSVHAGADPSTINDDSDATAAEPLPEPETEPKPDPASDPEPLESLADQCPWSNHRGLSSMARRGADGGVYTIQGWLPTPPPSKSRKSYTRVAPGSPNQVKSAWAAQERLARARQFWVLIDNGGDSYGSLGRYQAPCIDSQA